jgi:uncharacterized repeat protein (TIGR01451 family)
VQLKNTIVAHNPSGGNCAGTVRSAGFNVSGDGSCGFGAAGDLPPDTDPRLGPLASNGGPTQTHALLPGSPAIDRGTNDGCPAKDQCGVSRPRDGDGNGSVVCDIGAYEVEPLDLAITFFRTSPDQGRAGDELTYLVDVANLGPSPAAGVGVTATLPTGATFVRAFPQFGDGPCNHAAGTVTCSIGTLNGAPISPRATVVITVIPTVAGTLATTVRVSGSVGDPNPANNTVTISTTVNAAVTPPKPCAPRPDVGVAVVRNGDGRLRVTITARTSPGTPSNRLRELRFGASDAIVEAGSETRPGGNFTLSLPPGATQTNFFVRRQPPRETATVPLVVVDDCGPWSTFVGSGPRGF